MECISRVTRRKTAIVPVERIAVLFVPVETVCMDRRAHHRSQFAGNCPSLRATIGLPSHLIHSCFHFLHIFQCIDDCQMVERQNVPIGENRKYAQTCISVQNYSILMDFSVSFFTKRPYLSLFNVYKKTIHACWHFSVSCRKHPIGQKISLPHTGEREIIVSGIGFGYS